MINTDQKLLSLISYNVPGPWVDPGETHNHAGTWQALIGLYAGVMAVTYRPGVDATSSNLVLGTLRSDGTSAGSQMYFLSLDNLLGVGELANGAPAASSSNAALTISAVSETTAAMSTNDGTVTAPIARAIEFKVVLSTSAFASARVPILIQWPTDTDSNVNNLTVYLDIEFNA